MIGVSTSPFRHELNQVEQKVVMKWFKHLSDASDDEFIIELEELFGWEGYGRWFKILEIVAKKMDETDKCSVAFSWVKWQSLLKGKKNKISLFLVHCENKRKMNLKQTENILEITIPKLLEYRDNYTKHLQVTNNKLPRIDRDRDLEPDIGKKTKAKKIKSISKYSEQFESWWKDYPQNAGSKKLAFAKYEIAITNGESHERLAESARAFGRYLERNGEGNKFTPHAATWLHQARFETNYDTIETNTGKHQGNKAASMGSGKSADIDAGTERFLNKHGLSMYEDTPKATEGRSGGTETILIDVKPMLQKP